MKYTQIFVSRPVLFLIAMCGVMCQSCSSTKPLVNIQSVDRIDHAALLSVSSIALIDKGDRYEYSDSLSNMQKSVTVASTGYFVTPKISKMIAIEDDSALKERVETEMAMLVDSAMRQNSLDLLPVPPVIDSLVKVSGERYGMLISTTGFARTKKNYNNHIFTSIGIGIFTLGMFYTVPYRYSSNVNLVVVDVDENRVVFFRQLTQLDRNPMDEESYVRQLRKMVDGYFVL